MDIEKAGDTDDRESEDNGDVTGNGGSGDEKPDAEEAGWNPTPPLLPIKIALEGRRSRPVEVEDIAVFIGVTGGLLIRT